MDFHLDRAGHKLQQERKKEAAQRKREAAKRAAAKAKAEREAEQRAEKLAPVLEIQRQQLEELQRRREAAERERTGSDVVKGAGRKMHRAAIPQLCFRGAPPPVDRLNREQILKQEPALAAAVSSVDPGKLVNLLLARFGAKGASASSRNGSARQERCCVCSALRLAMVAKPDTAFALCLATIDRLASQVPVSLVSVDEAGSQRKSKGGGKPHGRNPTLPMCLLLDSLMATGLTPAGSDTELAEGFVLGAMQRPAWFSIASSDAIEPSPEPEVEPPGEESLARLMVSPRVLLQLMRIYAVRATSIPFTDRSNFTLGLLRSKSGNLKDVSSLVEVLELPFEPPYILSDLCKCQRWHVAVGYACGVGKRGGAGAATWAPQWTQALDVLITALELGPPCAKHTSAGHADISAQASYTDVIGRLVSTIAYGDRLDLLRQLSLEGGARYASLPAQVKLVEALRQKGAAPLVAAVAAEQLGDRCMAECFALNRQLLAAESLLAEPTAVAITSASIHFMSQGRVSPRLVASAIAGLHSASVVAIDAEWPPHWTEKQARLSGTQPLAALLQLALVGGSSDGEVIMIDLLPEGAVPDVCAAALELLADDSILKLGFSLQQDLRRIIPALCMAVGKPIVPPSSPEHEPEVEANTLDDHDVSGGQSVDTDQPGVFCMEDEGTDEDSSKQKQGQLGPSDVAKELERLGCLDGTTPAADQLFDPTACTAPARTSQPVKTILLLLTPDSASDGIEKQAPPVVVACVLGTERKLQLGRCASALGCPRSSLSLIPASELVSVCGFPRGAIGPVGLRRNPAGEEPRVLIDEELMPVELPTCTGDTAPVESQPFSISNSDLEAATILCGGGRADCVYRVRPRKLLQALGDRASVAMIHAEGVVHTEDLSFQLIGRAGRKQRKHLRARDTDTQPELAIPVQHTLDLQTAVGQMIPLRTTNGSRRVQDGPIPSPGLADTVSQVLGFQLDKSMQCSSWSDRPLSEAQLQYAAKDAIVLHLLYERISSGASQTLASKYSPNDRLT